MLVLTTVQERVWQSVLRPLVHYGAMRALIHSYSESERSGGYENWMDKVKTNSVVAKEVEKAYTVKNKVK